MPNSVPPHNSQSPAGTPPAPLSQAIGRSRYTVLLSVIAVLLVSVSLFLQGTVLAVQSVWQSWADLIAGHAGHAHLTLVFLEIVSIMLEAVVFYIIGVGLYSLFIAPMNVTVALGVESLNDLEERVISVIVAILAINFLEHFIEWKDPLATLEFGGALSLVIASLVAFQVYSHRATEDQKRHNPDVQIRAQRELFQGDNEEHLIVMPEERPGMDEPVDEQGKAEAEH